MIPNRIDRTSTCLVHDRELSLDLYRDNVYTKPPAKGIKKTVGSLYTLL